MEAHGEDLRRLIKDDALVNQLKIDYRQANLSERQMALCRFAQKLTLTPAKMTESDVQDLRAAGLTDKDILDAVEVIGYFNYINRVADGLGIDPEPWMRDAWEKRQNRAE